MKVKDIMQVEVIACSPEDRLSDAARAMWQGDCGFVVVVEREHDGQRSRRMVGVLTDRDVCMAAYTKNQPLSEIRVRELMKTDVAACAPGDDISVVHELMRQHQVRRVPVADGPGDIQGVISLNDLALDAANRGGSALKEVGLTLAAVCQHRPAQVT